MHLPNCVFRSFIACAALQLPFGCITPRERLSFPSAALDHHEDAWRYDVDRNGRADFGLLLDDRTGARRTLGYDDDENGAWDRLYRLDDYDSDRVPHLIVLLDSIPFQAVADRHARGEWPWFNPPQKVIPPFPTMSGLIFSRILHAPPLPGMINRHYDRRAGATNNLILKRVFGHENPWHARLHYHANYRENGLAFLKPREWFAGELARAKNALDDSPDRVTMVYLASTSGMLSRYGALGLDEILDALDEFCLQIMHEREGAVKISLLADHGHNLVAAKRISLEDTLREAGFRPSKSLADLNDVVIENDGMVNYIGIHTRQAARVAEVVVQREEVQLAMYMEGDRVIVRDAYGSAAIEYRNNRFRYTPIERDVLEFGAVVDSLRAQGKIDAEGFAADHDWFDATTDHEWPDAPRRLWDAFHGMAVNTPQVLITLNDGSCTGLGFLELFIDMASTHGGLNQVNSATFVMSMTDRATQAMRSEEVMPALEPNWTWPSAP